MEFSFIIPVYNAKAYLTACVESIRAAGAASYEILLVDDGSTDGSGALCDDLAKQYPQVRVVHQKNSGASAARNRGIREALGERILFVDADDGIDPGALGGILNDPRCGENDMTVFGMSFDYYHKGKCYRRDPLVYEYDGVMDAGVWADAFEAMYQKNALSPVWNKVFKRDILLRHGLELDTGMFLYEDFEFVLRYMSCCGSIWNVPKVAYNYRQSEDEGNAGRRLARIDSLPEFLEPIEGALDGLTGVPGEQKRSVLVQLHQVLAREKISVSDLAGIRRICGAYAAWYRDHGMTAGQNDFHRRLLEGKALSLLLRDKKTALRHAVAVRVKTFLRKA